jgi:hypothetical protein
LCMLAHATLHGSQRGLSAYGRRLEEFLLQPRVIISRAGGRLGAMGLCRENHPPANGNGIRRGAVMAGSETLTGATQQSSALC